MTLFVISDLHSGTPISLNQKTKGANLQKQCNRPGVLEERSKCIHLDKVREAQEGKMGQCRSRRQPLEDLNPDAREHLR